jgi:formate dehydrogenase major subunit
VEWVPPAEMPDESYPMYLTTGRVLYQYHTGTMSMRTPGLMTLAPESFVEISLGDAVKYGVGDGDMVKVTSRRGEIKARVKLSEKAVDGTVFIPFHYAESAANELRIIFVYRYLPIDEKIYPLSVLCASVVNT